MENPYFTAEPWIFFLVLRVLGCLTIPISLLGIYCVLKKNPPGRTKFFNFLVGHVTVVTTILEIDLTILSPPLVYLPYIALEFRGLLSWIDVTPEIQLEILITLIAASFGSIIPIVYYRMDVILSQSHWLNHIFMKIFIYFTVFFIAYILPPVLIALSVQDQEKTKSAYVQRFNIFYGRFQNPEVLAIYLGFENLFSVATAACAFGALAAGNVVLAVCGFILYHTLKTRKAEIAIGNTLKHQALVGSVATIILLFMIVVGIICPTIAILLISNSYRADLMNVTIILGASVVPITLSTYLVLYKPYRTLVFSLFRKVVKILRRRKNEVAPIYSVKLRPQ